MIGVFLGIGGGGSFKSRLPPPVIKVYVSICVIVSDFTGNSSSLQRRRLLSKYIYLLSRFPGKR